MGGSSPLARGLRPRSKAVLIFRRIIPARAGFTDVMTGFANFPTDHPRSRGVYGGSRPPCSRMAGSSPLARGLRLEVSHRLYLSGIIPARAGFTRSAADRERTRRDHPRSRGVYSRALPFACSRAGSSPLARGLRKRGSGEGRRCGIIPARAGFTWKNPIVSHGSSDHPRSRGVYTCGSLESQRTRTLPDPCCLHCRPRARSAELR